MEKKIIELKNISKNFEDQQVLKGIDLNIYENEFLTLLDQADAVRLLC